MRTRRPLAPAGRADAGLAVHVLCRSGPIEPSLLSYIWKFSRRDQLLLVAVTAIVFPVQYLALEIPKTIINRALEPDADSVTLLGVSFDPLTLLVILCFAFFLTVIGQGLLKMRLNTLKGMVSERMLRRFRYMLTGRIFRFPQPYFQRTSQGELVSMVTAEAEALGGMMGNAIALPLLMIGQMATVLAFLMIQNVWLGLAASALIPLQAWLIPKMQKRVNVLARERVREVRKFSTQIGESAGGAVLFRRSGGLRYWQAVLSDRLARLYEIRLELFKRKFMMKFVNNFITQLTPLMFYSIGGYLVIQGDLTIGALVAALAAHKDLAEPWKELLNYYNQIQESSVRYQTITERFAPPGIIDEKLITGAPSEQLALAGDIALSNVTVQTPEGASILKDITLNIPKGARVGLAIDNEEARKAFGDLVTREILPSDGQIDMAGTPLGQLHQSTLAARIGTVGPRPFVLMGSFHDNVLMPLMLAPGPPAQQDEAFLASRHREAVRSGNSLDPLDAEWVSPGAIGLGDREAVREWWIDMIAAIDSSGALLNRALDNKIGRNAARDLSNKLVALRSTVAERMAAEGLDKLCHAFDPDAYNPVLPVAANLFFAVPRRTVTQDDLIARFDFLGLLRKLDFEQELLILARDVIDLLQRIFGLDGVNHPLFRKLGIEPRIYERCVKLLPPMDAQAEVALTDEEVAILLTVLFQVSSEQVGSAFSQALIDRILALRPQARVLIESGVDDLLSPLDPGAFVSGLSVLDNTLFGVISEAAGPKARQIRDLVRGAFQDTGLDRDVYDLLASLPTELGGSNLSAPLIEALEVLRATVKRPDVVILDTALASYSPEHREAAFDRLRDLLPDTTFIFLEPAIANPTAFDAAYEIRHGQLFTPDSFDVAPQEDASPVSADLERRTALLRGSQVFSGLNAKQLQLLAFGARWYDVPAGTLIFSMGDDPIDGAYLIAEGEGQLFLPTEGGGETPIQPVVPGTLVGELALIRHETRALSLRASTDLKALRLGTEAFLSVIENDAEAAFKLLQVVAGYAKHAVEEEAD